jgi:hypothetical protein
MHLGPPNDITGEKVMGGSLEMTDLSKMDIDCMDSEGSSIEES